MSFKEELDKSITKTEDRIDRAQRAILEADEDCDCECDCSACTAAHGELSLRGDNENAEKELKELRAELARLKRYRDATFTKPESITP